MFEVYYTWGWRKSELLAMRVRHVDFAANVIRLDPEMVKNEEGREVTMTPVIRALVAECAKGKNDEDFLFTRDDGTPVRDFRKTWRNLCVAAGVPALHVHDMRRSAARNLVRAGVSQHVAMKITGHKTASIFQRYNIVDQRDISTAMIKLEQARFEHKVGHNAPTAEVDNAPRMTARAN